MDTNYNYSKFLTSSGSVHGLAASHSKQVTIILPVLVVPGEVAVPVGLHVSRHHLLLLADLLVLHRGRLLQWFAQLVLMMPKLTVCQIHKF